MMKIRWVLAFVVIIGLVLLIWGGVGLGLAQGPEQEKPVGTQSISIEAKLGTGFTYQGQLYKDGSPVNGTADFVFSLWDSLGTGSPPTGGNRIGATQEVGNVTVTGGAFTVQLNSGGEFGENPFNESSRWLQIAVVSPSDGGLATTLSPRQPLLAVPYAHSTRSLQGWTIDSEAPADGEVLKWDGTAWAPSADSTGIDGAGSWSLTGNAGTSSGTNRLGTTDNVTLTLVVNSTAALRLMPNSTSPNIAGGHFGNTVTPGVKGAVIGGGGYSGSTNYVTDDFGTIGGGANNRAGDDAGSTSDKPGATVGGGSNNKGSGLYSTVSGGASNHASGAVATIPGGQSNEASGAGSFAAGYRAKALHDGAFVWGDGSTNDISSTAANQFIVRASGGVTMYTNSSATSGARLSPGSGAWSTLSDRDAKQNFASVNGREVLDKVAAISVQTWNYKSQNPSIRHIGPMAQDFYAAFGVGEDDKHISAVDADGVALAAIQGLYQEVKELGADNASLRADNVALKRQVATLDQRLSALEKQVAGATAQPVAADLLSGGWGALGLILAGGIVAWQMRRRVEK